MRIVTGLSLIVAMVSGAVLAQPPVEKPRLQAGDRWVYRITDLWKNAETESYEIRIAGIAGDQVELDRTTLSSKSGQNIGQPSRRKADAASGAITDRRIEEGRLVAMAFPLAPGKTWDYEYRYKSSGGGLASQKRKATVEGWEDVTVPAGTFRALKVMHQGTWTRLGGVGGNESGKLTDTYWYAPEARRYIKREYADFTSQSGKIWNQIREELTSMELKK